MSIGSGTDGGRLIDSRYSRFSFVKHKMNVS
jgi:hypothetical protein